MLYLNKYSTDLFFICILALYLCIFAFNFSGDSRTLSRGGDRGFGVVQHPRRKEGGPGVLPQKILQFRMPISDFKSHVNV